MLTLNNIYARERCMTMLSLKKAVCWIFLVGLLLAVAACTSAEPFWKAKPVSTEPWWKGKPISQMTPAELEEQDPEFWPMWKHMHEDRL
jgi:hypothetical protein